MLKSSRRVKIFYFFIFADSFVIITVIWEYYVLVGEKMQLKQLEAHGFKSFADRVKIEFDRGITAIVGPNGSGKSNITDAVRWALGEQNIRLLRGTKSEDIIFTGSDTRRPMGAAEVTLSFLNDGTLPVDYSEVDITRRYFRSGDSEYYINKNRCRLKDIQLLFADTGLGQDGMSVISQNRIDEILNSKPEERRLFFEETAGITKYRSRKKEAMGKLAETDQNYVRVSDIVQEIESELGPLSEQAERTRQYNELRADYRKGQMTELCRQYNRLEEARKRCDGQLAELKASEAAALAAKGSAEAAKEENSRELLEREKELQELAAENSAIHDRIEAVAGEIRLWEERHRQRDENQQRLAVRQEEVKERLAEIGGEQEKLRDAAEELKGKKAEASAALQAGREKAAALAARVRRQRLSLEELAKDKENCQQTLAERQKAYALIERDIEAELEAGKLKEASEEALNRQTAEEKKILAGKEEAVAKNSAERTAAAEEQRSLQKREKKLTEEANRCRQVASAARQYAEQAEAKLQILQNMQQSYEGFGKAAKAVLKSRASWRSGVCGAVAELLTVPAEYVTAVDIALGAASQDIVTKNAETAQAAIEFLKRDRLGRVTFLPLDTLTERKTPELSGRAAGVIGWLNTLIEVEPEYQRAVDFLLSRTLLVDTAEHALALARRQSYKVRLVTLEGELINPGGSISGGSSRQQESGYLNRSSEISVLTRTLATKRQEADCQLERLNGLKAESEQVNGQLNDIRERINELTLDGTRLAMERERAEEELGRLERELADLAEWKARRELTFAKAQERKVMAAREIRELEGSLQSIISRAQGVRDELTELEQEAEAQAKLVNEAELKETVAGQEILRCKEKLMLLSRRQSEEEAELEKATGELLALQDADESGREKIRELEAEREKETVSYQAGMERQQAANEARLKCLADSRENEKKISEASALLNRLTGRQHNVEIEASRVDFELEQCEKQLSEDFGKKPAEAAGECLGLKPGELKKYLEDIRQRLTGLGTVNPQAIEEYENRRTRHDFLKGQLDDLAKAKDNLMLIVQEINRTMARRFNEAFARIKEDFNDIFVRLFGGGEAKLELTDEKNVLQSGVEIIVRLPEKKQQNLSALSGGERALTVIALLFAFLRCKPAPFSVLDEIDAALDESNIGRFSSFLREFSGKTQFIIVTHRKKTMEAADVLYGVTLADAGVSQLLSLRLKQD